MWATSFGSNFGDPPDSDATYAGAWSTRTITTIGPTHGSARIFVDGHQVATVSTHAATVGFRRIKFARAWWGGPNDPVHTIRIVNAAPPGTAASTSTGSSR